MTAPARAKATAPEREETAERVRKTDTAIRPRSAAAERAYARREERKARSSGVDVLDSPVRETRAPQRERAPKQEPVLQTKVATSRVPFVLGVMGLLGAGLVTTLWLSIAAVSGSYQLQQGEHEINGLSERKENLMREVSGMDSTPALQRRATEQGMVLAPEPAQVVVNPDGSVTTVGQPAPAVRRDPAPAPAPVQVPALNAPAVEGR